MIASRPAAPPHSAQIQISSNQPALDERRTRSGVLGFARTTEVRIGLAALLVVVAGAVWGQFAPPYDPLAQDFAHRFQLPTLQHPLGTDQFGRDLLSRILAGALPMCTVAAGSTAVAIGIGVPVGLLCAAAGRVGAVLSRVLDGIQAFPSILLALVLAAVLDASYTALIAAIGLSFFPLVARVTEAFVDSQMPMEYVQAARVISQHPVVIVLRHVLPNGTSALIVQATTILALSMLNEAALSFLGLGPASASPSWGRMLYDARQFLELAPHIALVPLVAIAASVLACNILGDGLRDVLDPTVSAQRLA